MEIFSFSSNLDRKIDRYGSVGAYIKPILQQKDGISIVSIWIESQGLLGLHPAMADQLFLVAAGEAFISKTNMDEVLIKSGSAVIWKKGEVHQTRAGKQGLLAIVIEGEGLAGSINIPPTGSMPAAPV
jgi:mannose-6-phosphate isomerase-like protein (cupin superfamily)